MIKKVAGPVLANYNFVLEGKQGSARIAFSKKRNDETQFIVFQKSNFQHALRIEFSTSIKPIPMLGHRLAAKDINKFWWEYNDSDNDSKCMVINDLLTIAINNGIDYLEIMSIPELEPTEEMAKSLMDNTVKKSVDFANKFGLDFDSIYDSLVKIQNLIVNNTQTSYAENKDFFIDAAAYVGELISKHYGGIWKWNMEYKQCDLAKIGGKDLYENILSWITNYWNKPNSKYHQLIYMHQNLLEFIE
jgi:hypothetical protein